MSNLFDVVFSPELYLERDKALFGTVENLLLRQASCATVCMYGNGKDYLFTNLVRKFQGWHLPYTVKILNTVSADELRDFADMLVADTQPTMCLVNLRIGKDVSWFIKVLDELRVKRGYQFVSYVNSYVGDIFSALQSPSTSVMQPLLVLGRITYEDSLNMMAELASRFEFYPNEQQQQDIYKWSYGHVGFIRSLFLLKSQAPEHAFTAEQLLSEPSVLERLNSIINDLTPQRLKALQRGKLSFADKALLQGFGYTNKDGSLFHPLLVPLLTNIPEPQTSALSVTEESVVGHLRSHQGQVISRQEIAKLVWGEEEWEDKYSDWAIGQLIYRLRRKLAYSADDGTIQTKKGQGFIYLAANKL